MSLGTEKKVTRYKVHTFEQSKLKYQNVEQSKAHVLKNTS